MTGLFLLVLLFYGCSKLTYAQVVINEVMPAPSSGNDWVELLNLTDQSLNLAGWILQDASSAMTTNPALNSQILAGNGYLVVEVSNRLNNTGDSVKLLNKTGEVVDLFSYTQSVVDQSWSRIPDLSGIFALSSPSRGTSNPQPSPTPTPAPTPSPTASPLPSPSASPSPTPKPSPSSTPISSPTPSPSPTQGDLPLHIVISEIMACPNTNEPEWAELQNLDNSPYSLVNWQLKDKQQNRRYFTSQITPQGLVVIQILPGMLNNTGGDELSVIRPDGVTTNWASYTTCDKGKSLIFDGQNWLAAEPSPGAANPDLSASNVANTSSSDLAVDTSVSTAQTTENSPTPSLEAGNVLGVSVGTSNDTSSGTGATGTSSRLNVPLWYVDNGFTSSDSADVATPSAGRGSPTLTDSPPLKSKNGTVPLLGRILIIGSSVWFLGMAGWYFRKYQITQDQKPGFIFEDI